MSRWPVLAVALVLGVSACGSSSTASSPASPAAPASPASPNGCPAAAPTAGVSCSLPATPEGPFCSYPATAPAATGGEHVCSCDGGKWLCFDKPAGEPPAPPP